MVQAVIERPFSFELVPDALPRRARLSAEWPP